MNRTFSERKPKKVDAKNKENETIIRALYMYGRVPEQWELLNEIERLNNALKEYDRGTYCKLINENRKLNNIINELEKHLEKEISDGRSEDNIWLMGCYDEDREILDKLHELKDSDK